MHNLAIELYNNDHAVSGSDDEIYEPSRSKLENVGLLPKQMGWKPERITKDLDLVILGMHARPDNPELKAAQDLKIPIVSYPEYLGMAAKDKKRIVIAGSHGKTSTTAMILQVLKHANIDTDYMVGAQLEGFTNMVRISDAPVMIFEGDEYLSSPIDRRPKIMHYQPHLTVITGIAWDHINVFPTFENYCQQFQIYIDSLSEECKIIHYENDLILNEMINNSSYSNIPYTSFDYKIDKNHRFIVEDKYPLAITGTHNMQNLKAAYLVCKELGVSKEIFFEALKEFKGAAKRLELLGESNQTKVFLDFAHAPSKVKATVDSLKKQYFDKKLIVALELHTFSSLNKDFLPEYKNALDSADEAIVCYSSHTLEMKKMPPLSLAFIKEAFDNEKLSVFNHPHKAIEQITHLEKTNSIVVFMSSGNFGKTNLKELAKSFGKNH